MGDFVHLLKKKGENKSRPIGYIKSYLQPKYFPVTIVYYIYFALRNFVF